MKKIWAWIGGIAAALALTGLGAGEMIEYFQAARGEAGDAIRAQIPLHLELRRMENLIGKLDHQLGKQKHEVAKQTLALTRAERDLKSQEQLAASQLQDMRKLRVVLDRDCKTIQVGCRSVSMTDVERGLGQRMERYQILEQTISARNQAVAKLRTAIKHLNNQAGDWQQERDLLAIRVESLKVRALAQTRSDAASSLDEATLAKATALADRIEERLQVAETIEGLSVTDLDPLVNTADVVDVKREFDGRFGVEAERRLAQLD